MKRKKQKLSCIRQVKNSNLIRFRPRTDKLTLSFDALHYLTLNIHYLLTAVTTVNLSE